MVLFLFFAFLAGIFTVLSPCILPILPVILAGSAAQGKARPLGIVTGLVVSFTFFTLALTAIVHATGLSPNALRYAAIVLICLFGLVMIFPRLSNYFARLTAPIANLGQRVQGQAPSNGFWGGAVFGVALGLLWTPCAGPILATITTLVATHAINFSTVLMTLAYSIGAGLPMFAIAYGGNRIIHSSQFLSRHAERLRQGFGCLMLLVAVVLFFHWDLLLEQKLLSTLPRFSVEKKLALPEKGGKAPLSDMGKAPELTGITGWINSPPLTLEELRGKVVLIDFWTYTCINCLRTLPYVEKWYTDYKDKGFVVIGVHTPEFEFEKDQKNVADAVKRLGITYPVALDNNYQTWNAYNNHYWPAHYLVDQQGNLREAHFGEGEYLETENAIRDLLGLAPLEKKEVGEMMQPLSPETYLGLARGRSYPSDISLKSNITASYTYKAPLSDDQVGLKGSWRAEQEYIEAEGPNCYLDYNFLASDVYLVLAGSSKTPVQVFLDGKPASSFTVDGDRKYDIVHTSYGRHQLSIKVPSGIRAYAFTFGS